MCSGSNAIQVALPRSMDLQPATDALKRFGEISHIEILPGGTQLTVSAVFFDVRSAAAARIALGDKCCKVSPQVGPRTVRLPGSMQLSAEALRNISSVNTDPEDEGGALVVEFFDIRDAQRMEQMVCETEVVKLPPGLELPAGLSPPPGLALPAAAKPPAPEKKETLSAAAPVYLQPPVDVQFGSPASPAPSAESDKFEVMLQDIPKALCSGDYLEAMLDQAGLAGSVVSCFARSGSNVGEALLKLATKKSAKKCVKHFHGRRWDMSGACPPLTATLLVAEGEEKPKQTSKLAARTEECVTTAMPCQMEAVMEQYFASAAGKKLLSDESAIIAAAEEAPMFNWDDFSDVSDSEQQGSPRNGCKHSTRSTASTVDVDSEAGEQEVM